MNIPTLIVLLVVAALLVAAIRRIRKKGACDCGECTDCDKDLTSCGHAGVCSSCPHKETPHATLSSEASSDRDAESGDGARR